LKNKNSILKLNEKEIFELANGVFQIEIDSLIKVKENLDKNFYEAIKLIINCSGKLVVTGMGKSGLIANKIAATLSSTGTLSVFLHPAEGLHGDLGVVANEDIVIILGKSGESEEVLRMLPALKEIGCKIISITGNIGSTLAKNSDIILDSTVDKEACNLNLAPTSSTTTALVMGDAISTVLSTIKKFNERNYALYHPGGRLGKRLHLKVKDFMYSINDVAICHTNDTVKNLLIKMSEINRGACLILNNNEENNQLLGIVSDGDMKRIFMDNDNISKVIAKDVMTRNPKVVNPELNAYDALLIMQKSDSFSVLPVVNNKNEAVGLLRMHDLLKAGL